MNEREKIEASRKGLISALDAVQTEFEEIQRCCDLIREDYNGHYVAFSIEDALRIAYAAKGDKFNGETRQRTSLGRYLVRQTKCQVNDMLLDFFCREVARNQPVEDRFEIISGEDIRTAYREHVGGSSCMTGSCADERLDIYVQNPNVVELLVYRDPKITARALLWETDQGKFCDRIYPNDGYHVPLFDKYCKARKWTMRPHQGVPTTWDDIDLDVTVDKPASRSYPYLDSFMYTYDNPGAERDGTLTLSTSHGSVSLDSTGGGWSGSPQICDVCGEQTTEGRMYEDDHYCPDCYSEEFTACDRCSYTYRKAEIEEIEIGGSLANWCAACLRHRAFTCDACRSLTDSRQRVLVVTDDDGGISRWCPDCAERATVICPTCNSRVRKGVVCCPVEESEAVNV